MEKWKERHFSQAALSTYQVCPLRFRYRYIEDLYWSTLWGTAPEERAGAERGTQFHLLARRYYSGLTPAVWEDPVDPPALAHWLERLKAFLPYEPERAAFLPEHELRLTRPESGFRLMAKFDLITVRPDGTAAIYDWKTERQFPKRDYLINRLQTRVYRYLLVAAGGAYSPRGRFRPEDVTMTYWNPQFPEHWERFEYTQSLFEQDERILRKLVADIIATPPESFHATPDTRVCRHCEYSPICHGRKPETVAREEEEWLFEEGLSWDRLPEMVD